MAIITVGEVLDRGRDFERRLEEYYAAIRDCTPDNGVRLLTYYLARHCRHQERGLEHLDDGQKRKVRAIELKFDVKFSPDGVFRMLDIPADKITGNALLEAAAAYDGQLIDLYRSILRQPLIDEARSVIEALVKVEERDIVMLKKMRAMNYF